MSSVLQRLAARLRSTPRVESLDLAPPSMQSLQRDVSLLQAEFMGAQSHVGEFGSSPGAFSLSRQQRRELRNRMEKSSEPYVLIDPRPGLRIVDLNEAFASATLTKRSRIEGDKLFSALPGSTDDDSVAITFEAYKTCAQRLAPYTLPLQRYDMRDASGTVLKCLWRATYMPIMDDAGRLVYILTRPIPLPRA